MLDILRDRGSHWPQVLRENEELIRLVTERRQLVAALTRLYRRVPRADMEIAYALAQGLVDEDLVARVYEALATLLSRGAEHARIVLYLPFELLPSPVFVPKSTRLQHATGRLVSEYRKSWNWLLQAHDVRANFVDGDVLEPELLVGDYPRVVKAAHLIPKLVDRGILCIREVGLLASTTSDVLLRENIAEAMLVVLSVRCSNFVTKESPAVAGLWRIRQACGRVIVRATL